MFGSQPLPAPMMNQAPMSPFAPQPLPAPGAAPMMSQPPPSPFAPQPLPFGGFRQEGGPVQPGRAYIVGERGPEMIVPQQPGMVVPSLSPGARAYLERQKAPQIERTPVPFGALNLGLQTFAAPGAIPGDLVSNYTDPNNGSRITSNPANRRYSEMHATNVNGPAPYDSLANRAVRPVGRSMREAPERRLETAARRGDQRATQALVAMKQQGLAQQFSGNLQQQQQDFQMQRDAQNFQQAQTLQTAADARAQKQADQRWQQELTLQGLHTGEQAMRDERDRVQREAEQQAAAAAGLETMTDPEGRFMIPGIRTQGGQFRPMGGAFPTPQPAPPPQVEMQRIPGTDQYVPIYDGRPLAGQPTYTGGMVPGSLVRRSTQGQPVPMQFQPTTPQPTEKVTVSEGDVTRTFTQPRGQTPAAGAGAAGGQPPPGNGTAPFTTPGGVRVNMLPDQASAPTMLTGQMPNEAYANPLTPEQSLEAARAEYLRTGDDTALTQHFKQFPSQAVQLNRQEGQVWNQIGQNVGQMATNANLRGRQIQERNAYIDRFSSSPLTQGAIAEEYARNFPQGMTEINRAPVRPNFDLMTQADQLNRQAQQAAGRAAPPAMLPLGPTDPVMPLTRADRYPGGAYDRLMRTTLPVPRVTTRSV
jgi:hypothetical protein